MKVVCAHCGLPFSVARPTPGRAVYCCSGCALAARISTGGRGTAPVNAALVGAIGVGFAFFNQALFWMLAVSLAQRGGTSQLLTAARCGSVSLALGLIVWCAVTIFQLRSGVARALDRVVWVAGGVALAGFVTRRQAFAAIVLNLGFAAWSARGLLRKKSVEKSRD